MPTLEQATEFASRPGNPCEVCLAFVNEHAATVALRERVAELEAEQVRRDTANTQARNALAAQLADVQRELGDEQNKAVTRKVTLQRLQLQCEALERERDQLQGELTTLSALAQRVKAEYATAQIELTNLHSKLLTAKDDVATTSAELRASKEDRGRLARELKETQLFLEAANKRRTETDDALQIALASIRELQDTVEAEKAQRRADRAEFDEELKRVPAAVYMPSRRRLGVLRSITSH